MPFTIATKAAFLVALTWHNGFVKHEYVGEYPSAAHCFEAARAKMEPASVDWTTQDMGCTYQVPIGKHMVFSLPEDAMKGWESAGFFIIPE
jgi:hypothetical protein